jgi:hypothetical protein
MKEVSNRSFSLPSSSVLLFAKYIDDYFVSKMKEEWSDLLELVIGGRDLIQFSAEVELVSLISFYLPLMLNDATPGQLFCGLKQFVLLDSKSGGIRTCGAIDKTKTALLYCVLPYLFRKKLLIGKTVCDIWNVLVTSEESEPANVAVETHTAASEASFSNGVSNKLNNGRSKLQLQNRNDEKPSYLWSVINAVKKSLVQISNETEERFERMGKFFYDIHLYYFCQNGK